MKRMFAGLLVVALALSGCALAQLQKAPTPEQVQLAACSDAQDGILLATVALGVAGITPEKAAYWNKWLGAAEAIRDAKCVAK